MLGSLPAIANKVISGGTIFVTAGLLEILGKLLSIEYPDHVSIEDLSFLNNIEVDGRVLDFNNLTRGKLDVSSVRPNNNFSKLFFYQVLPREMPSGDTFIPGVALVFGFVRPMPDLDFPTF